MHREQERESMTEPSSLFYYSPADLDAMPATTILPVEDTGEELEKMEDGKWYPLNSNGCWGSRHLEGCFKRPVRESQLEAVLAIEPDTGDHNSFEQIDIAWGWNQALKAVHKAIEEAGR